jgi:uncharacterized protein (DUF305 family)
MKPPGGLRRGCFAVGAAVLVGGGSLAEPAEAQTPPSVVRPGAPGTPTRILSAEELRAPAQALHTGADVLFMQHMIVHHRQALTMSALAPERTEREDIRQLARRIELSQDAEIAFMKRWLELRGEEAPKADADHAHHMAGMLSDAQLDALAVAEGPAFDRAFLELMIFHHEGALEMVTQLLAAPGAARDSDIFGLAAHVYADQRMEIGRMRAMLQASP